MDQHNTAQAPRSSRGARTSHQAHAVEPETAQERIERVRAAAAVQIAHAYTGQPTKWTLAAKAMHWVMAHIDRLVEREDLLS